MKHIKNHTSPSESIPPGRAVVSGLDDRAHLGSRAAELLRLIKKKTTSGKMWDKQMAFAMKLAEFEEVYEATKAQKLEAGESWPDAAPRPAWLSDPTPQPHWSIEEARLAGGGGGGLGPGGSAPGPAGSEARPHKTADALKSMIISMHRDLLNLGCMRGVSAAAAAAGVRLRTDDAAPSALVAFQRARAVASLQAADHTMHLSAGSSPCRRYLAVMSSSKAAELVQARALSQHVSALLRARPGHLTLLIYDAPNYFKQGELRFDLEEEKVDLHVSLGVATLLCHDAEQLAVLVLQVARALAEEPYKLSRRAADDEAQFYMRGDNKQCVAVDARGNGLGQLWQQMLGVLPQSSLEVSRALAAHCPTPRRMAQTVQRLCGAARLCDLPVARSAAPGARPRRLGPEMAHKLNVLFDQHGSFKLE